MITSICRLNTVLVALFLLGFVSTGYGFMSEKKKVVIHIPDEITYVRHYHPKIVYVKKKYHGSSHTTTTSGHGLKGGGTGGGFSGGRNPLKLLLSSEIHSTDTNPGSLNQGSYSIDNNIFPPSNLNGNAPYDGNNGWVDNEIKLHDLQNIHNNNELIEFPPLNGFGDNSAPNNNLGQGQDGLPESEVAGGIFNDGNKDLGNDLHHSSSSIGASNGVTSLGPQLFSNNGGNSGHIGFSNGGNNFQSQLGHNEGNSIGNYGGSYGSEQNGASVVGQNSGFPQEGNNNGGNGWPVGGVAGPSSVGVSQAWPEKGLVGGFETAGSNDWVPITYPPDNSLWWPMNGENWLQNHASQPQVQNNFNQGISNPNPGYGTQGGVGGNAFIGVTGNGAHEGISYTPPYSQIQSSEIAGQFTGSNNGNYGNTLTSSIEVPWRWKDQTRPSELANAGFNGNAHNIIRHPEVTNNHFNGHNFENFRNIHGNGYAMSYSNRPNFESAANYYGNGNAMSHTNRPNFEGASNYGGYPAAANGITSNNEGVGLNHGALASNYVNGLPHSSRPSSFGVNSNRPVGNNLGSSNHHGIQTYNGFGAAPNIVGHMATTGTNGNHAGYNPYQSGHIKNANNVACKRLKLRKVKVDSYHPCYEPNSDTNQESLNSAYHVGNNYNTIEASYNVPINSIMAHSGGYNGNNGAGNSNHANNGIYPLNPNVHGASINNHASGGNHNRLPFYANNLNNYDGNSVHSAPIYGPVNNAQFNQFHQGYTETMSSYFANLNNANNIHNNNYGGIRANGAVSNVNYQNNEVGTHIVMGGSALGSNNYYGPTESSSGRPTLNHAVNYNTKYTTAKARPNIFPNGVNSSPYNTASTTNYGTNNHLSGISNAPTNYGGFSNNPSHPGGQSSIYYDNNGNNYNTVGSISHFGLNNNQVNSNGRIVPGGGHSYGGNSFEVSSNNPFGNTGNVQGYSNAPVYGGNPNDAHSSPSSTNFGALLSYVDTGENNLKLTINSARNKYFGRSGANRVPSQAPASNYGSPSNNYRSATNGSLYDITSEHGNFVSYPTNNNGQSTYRGNSNSFITSANYGSGTSKPHYSEVPEHRGLPITTHVGRGPLSVNHANGGGATSSGRFTTPPHQLNTLNEIIQNSNIYKGIANLQTDTPNKFSLASSSFGVNGNHANIGTQSVPSKVQFVTNVEYRKPNSANHLGNVAYTIPTTPNKGNVVYSAPIEANVAYSAPTSPNKENIVYSVPTTQNQANLVYSPPNSQNQGSVAYSVSTNANQANIVYSSPTSQNQGNVIYSVPTRTSNENTAYSLPTNINDGNIVYNAPINVNDGKGKIYSLSNKVNHGKNNAQSVPTRLSHGNVPHSLPYSVNHGANHVYRVPSTVSQGNVEYSVPNQVSHGPNNVYSIPNSGSQNNIVYSVPNNGGQHENNIYNLNKPASHGSVISQPPNGGHVANTVYNLPSSPNTGNNNAHAYTVPNSASQANNIVYTLPNGGSQGNVVYNVPVNGGNGNNIVYSVPNSASHVYSVPNDASQGNVVYSVPSSVKQGNNAYRGPGNAAVLANSAPQTFPGNEIFASPSPYRVAGNENERIVVPYSLPNNYRNASTHHHGGILALQGLTSSDNRGNNAAYDSFSSNSGAKTPNVAHAATNSGSPFTSTNFVNHINRLVSSDSNRNVEFTVPIANNSNSIAQSGSNINNAYSEPINENTGNSVFSVSNNVNHGNNAYSVSNSVRHINSAFSVETSSGNGNGKGNHGTKSAQGESSNRTRNKGTVKRRRLKHGNYRAALPDNGSSEKDIIENIHEEAVKFVENYKIPDHGNFGASESSERQWNTRQNIRSLNGVYSNRKSRHTINPGGYAVQNGDNRVNNYTPSGPVNLNLVNGSRMPFNANRPGNGRNDVNMPLHNLSSSENHANASDGATRNYRMDNSNGGYNTRKFRGI